MDIEQVIEFIQSATPGEKTRIRKALDSTKAKRPLNMKTLKSNVADWHYSDFPPYHTWRYKMTEAIYEDMLKDFEGLCEKVGVQDLSLAQATKKITDHIQKVIDESIKRTEEDFKTQNKSSIGVRYNPGTDRYEAFYQ